MRTRIFFAFLVVIMTALLSTLIFQWLILRDFTDYVSEVRKDQFYWITASAESSYENGKWDEMILSETVHWAMMMGVDVKIVDSSGNEIASSSHVVEHLGGSMKERMNVLFYLKDTRGEYLQHPLYGNRNARIGTLLWRPFEKKKIAEKEAAFRAKTGIFLIISFLIAGVGSVAIAFALSKYLSRPISNLRESAERIARGDFSVRTKRQSNDEVGELSDVFNKMAESLQREEALRRKLLSNLAHELRTPLTIMRTQVDAVADGIIEDSPKALETIGQEISGLTRLVKGMEDITTAEASFFSRSEETDVELSEFLSGIADDMGPLFREKNLNITVSGDGELHVRTDAEKIERVIRNILSNALKFTREGGVIISYGLDKERFFVSVKDTGIGIPEEALSRIFDRFYKGERSGGLGLGLSIVKELVEVMQGEIRVESRIGQGTCFTITLPKQAASQ